MVSVLTVASLLEAYIVYKVLDLHAAVQQFAGRTNADFV